MRYLPLSDQDRYEMLTKIGVNHVDDLFADIPQGLLNPEAIHELPKGMSEAMCERHLTKLANMNLHADQTAFFIGAGAYRHHVPSSVDHLIQRSEFMTAYTPYQAEIAQGTLQTMFEFQTQVCELTAMDVANASIYDGSTAAGEAMLMACRLTRRSKVIIAGGVHPHYREVMTTLANLADHEHVDCEMTYDWRRTNAETIQNIDEDTACIVIQMPDFFGNVFDLSEYADAAHAKGALLIAVFANPFAFGLIEAPGNMGADIVAGEGQAIGNGLNFGGPYVGLFACRKQLVRQMPGRVCGETVDTKGRRGFVLTLAAREQHIRRGKATSNICTNAGLCVLAFTIHATLLGAIGLNNVAKASHQRAIQLADELSKIAGVTVHNQSYFNEFTVELPRQADAVINQLVDHGVLGGVPVSRFSDDEKLAKLMVVAATELNSNEDIERYASALKKVLA